MDECNGRPPEYEPTPEEIRAACLEIQAEWTDDVRLKRLNKTMHPKAWEFERRGRIRFQR